MNWYKKSQIDPETAEIQQQLAQLVESLKVKYPVSDLYVWYSTNGGGYIELANIEFSREQQSQGYGTQIVKELQAFAQSIGKPIVLRPEANPGKKKALDRFYRRLDFVHNRGRNKDFQLSSPFASTMHWKPPANPPEN